MRHNTLAGGVFQTRRSFLTQGAAVLVATMGMCAGTAAADDPPATTPSSLPAVYLIGDSTVKNGTPGQQGWGDPFAAFFDPAKIRVVNRARGGRSSRTYLTEGLWEAVLADLKPGDFVLMQFGHNDGGPLDEGRARASLKGNGDESREVTIKETGKKEVVHTYGWYLRRYIADARAKGATPIVLSLVPRNRWSEEGKVYRAAGDYGKWTAEAAQAQSVAFVDLNEIIAGRYEAMGREKVAAFFSQTDHTHTNPEGAEVNAAAVVAGLKALKECKLCDFLSAKGSEVTPYAAKQAARL